MAPQSPTAYSLGKYGDVPVGLYTGVPNIFVPLIELKDKDISINISLSYHGSGIKVDEMASFVGLGWSLNAGGVITRVVKGRAETLLSGNVLFPKRANIKFYDRTANPSHADFIYDNELEAAATGQIDTEPDEFYYNFCGRTGKFSFDKSGEAFLEKLEGLNIRWEYVSSDVQKFIIKDEKGCIYEFKDYEETFYNYPDGVKISAWYLSKITSATGSVITLEYSSAGSVTQYVRSYVNHFVDVIPNNTFITPPPFSAVPFVGVNNSEIRLQKIISKNGYIEFNYQSQKRQDFHPTINNLASRALNNIVLYRTDNSLLKRIELSTSYFVANNGRKYNDMFTGTFSYLNYRLRLDALIFFSSSNIQSHTGYHFTYLGDNNETTNDPYTLPHRLSPAQDHWGYYNHSLNTHMIPGKDNNTRVIMTNEWFKQFMSSGSGGYSTYTTISGGANREPDSEGMKAGMLNKIYYPAGGYSELFFEPNTNNFGGLRIQKIIDYPVTGTPKETQYSYSAYSYFDPRDYYFEAYKITYNPSPIPSEPVLESFGVPLQSSSGTYNYIKISVQPRAILGLGAQIGYSSVKVSSPGNGFTQSSFAASADYADYTDNSVLLENTTQELRLLDGIFNSEYIDDSNYPILGGLLMSKSISFDEWPYPDIYSNKWKRGMLTSRVTCSENSTVLKAEKYTYYKQLLNTLPGFKVKGVGNHQYVYSRYYIPHSWNMLKSSEITDYDDNGQNPVTSLITYYYDNLNHLQPTRMELSRSDGKKEVTAITYALDYAGGTTFIDNMKVNHLLAYPIEQIKYLDNGNNQSILSGSITTYKTGGKGLKDMEQLLETNSSLSLSSFKFSNRSAGILPPVGIPVSFSADNHYKPRLQYDSYDNLGNLLQYTLRDGSTTSYLWDYSSRHLVAMVENANQTDIAYCGFEGDGKGNWVFSGSPIIDPTSVTGKKAYYMVGQGISKSGLNANKIYVLTYWVKGTTQLTVIGGTVSAATELYSRNGWTQYRSTFSGTTTVTLSGNAVIDDVRLYPHGSIMVTYTYDPLLGITSKTDEKGNVLYYEYDDFQRLKSTRDLNGNIIEEYNYHYNTP